MSLLDMQALCQGESSATGIAGRASSHGSAALRVEMVAGRSAVTRLQSSNPMKLLVPKPRGPSVWAVFAIGAMRRVSSSTSSLPRSGALSASAMRCMSRQTSPRRAITVLAPSKIRSSCPPTWLTKTTRRFARRA